MAVNEIYAHFDPETWLRLCDACTGAALIAEELAFTFDLATWRDPRKADPAVP